jgi:hypothetical protein
MSWDCSILHLRRPLANRDGTGDPLALPPIDCMARAADSSLGTQVPEQLLFQGTARLDEKAAVDRLV